MPWFDAEFNETADAAGQITKETELTASIGGRLLRYKVKTEDLGDNCLGRAHETTVTIEKRTASGWELFCTLGPVSVTDCLEYENEVPDDCRRIQAGTYRLRLSVKGFRPQEPVKGVAAVRVSFLGRPAAPTNTHAGGTAAPTPAATASGWERQYWAEEAVKEHIRNTLQGEFVDDYVWDRKSNCGIAGRQNNGRWRNSRGWVSPNYDSIEIWVNWDEGLGRGSMRIDFSAQDHRIQWNCGVRTYDWKGTGYGWLDLQIGIDVSSGSAVASVDGRVHVEDVNGFPDRADETISGWAERFLKQKFDAERGNLKRLIEERIQRGRLTLSVPSVPEAFGLEAVAQDELLYDLFLDEFQRGVGGINVWQYSELNPELIAQKVNEQRPQFTIDHIDAQPPIFFRNLVVDLTPVVQPGQIRIITAPAIRVEFNGAECDFVLNCNTNLFDEGRMTASGRLSLTFAHTYEAEKIEFGDLRFLTLRIEQAPGFSEFVRRQFNARVPDELRDNDQFLRQMAEILNDAIREIVEGFRTSRLLTRQEFADAVGVRGPQPVQGGPGCKCVCGG